MARAVLPHAVAGPRSVDPGPWMLETAEGQASLGDSLPHWDYSTDLLVSRSVVVDSSNLVADCRLTPEDSMVAAAAWRSTATGLREVAAAVPIDAGAARLELGGVLPGSDLGGDLILVTQILLAAPGRGADPLAARRPGSILWWDRQSVRLEGVAGRFPVEVLDLEDLGIPGASEAAWYLDWPGTRLQDSATGGTRLYINSRNETVVDAVSQEAPDDRAKAIWSAIRHDVGRTLINGALSDPDFLADPDGFDTGSMGASIRQLLRALWPDEPPEALAARLRDLPEDWAAELQDRLRLFASD